jgi:hypothetical protein
MFEYIECSAEDIKEFKQKYLLDYHPFEYTYLYKVFSVEHNDYIAIIQFDFLLSRPYISWFETFRKRSGYGIKVIEDLQLSQGITEMYCKPSDYETEKFWYKCGFWYDSNLSMFKWKNK